jgi:hypothetical protein
MLTATITIVVAGILLVVSRTVTDPSPEITNTIPQSPSAPVQITSSSQTSTTSPTTFQGPVGAPHIKGPSSNPPNY